MPRRAAAVAGTLFILLMCALCVRLGFWQLGRLEQRRAANRIAERGLTAPPRALDSRALAEIARDPMAWRYRRVRVRGPVSPDAGLLLRGRSDGGRPGVHLVEPMRLGSAVLLLNRGWLPAPDGTRPGVRPPSPIGDFAAEGVLMELPRTGDRGVPAEVDGTATYRRLDLAEMRSRHGPGLLPLYLQLSPTGGDSLPRPVPLPVIDEGPHLSYALQWFGFAITGIIGLLLIAFRSRGRRPG